MKGTRRRGLSRVGTLVLVAGIAAVPSPGGAQQAPAGASPGLDEVDRLPVTEPATTSGWLVLNPVTRRAYQIFEGGNTTVIQSFDLDTLKPRKRLELAGVPIPTGRRDGFLAAERTGRSAEVVHAVDEQAGVLYLALSGTSLADPVNLVGTSVAQDSQSADAKRLVSRYVAVDEKALDQGREAVASFREPVTQQNLRTYWLQGMEVDTAHRDRPGRHLVLLFAQPTSPAVPVHNHELVRWDVGSVTTPTAGSAMSLGATDPRAMGSDRRELDVCRSAPLTPISGANASGSGSQMEMLVRRDDVVLACQSAPDSGAVVRLARGAGGAFPPAGAMTVYPLGRRVFDAVADRGDGRLFLRTTDNDGETWWVFDADVRRFTGSLAAKLSANGSMTPGMDHSTGRMYLLMTDYPATFAGGEVSVRGGLQFADTRLFTPVPFENARPELAYPAVFRIRVDPVTRRVFVRRGRQNETACVKYPSTQSVSSCPVEPFYRVFKDSIPVPQEPEAPDDSAFTTDVEEKEGVTRASYLGTGSGFGVRKLLVGGLSAASFGQTDRSPCSRDDRELLSASVGQVSVSDIAAAAEASALDADLGTQKIMASPVRSCVDGRIPPQGDTEEFSFDRRTNKKPYPATPDGVNDYEASCVGEGTDSPPPHDNRRVPRGGFRSEVVCDYDGAHARGQADGAFVLPAPLSEQDREKPQPATDVRVAKARSEVTMTRRLGSGIRARVDSWARGVTVPGVGQIGAVRAEATVAAAGTPGTADADYERTICDIDMGEFRHLGCLDLEKDEVVTRLNEAAAGRAEFRVRNVDPKLEKGSPSGYQAGIQRDRLDGFSDRILARDESLAVPALEIVLYQGSGRQIVQLAGAEATVSYGIACLYGQGPDGECSVDGAGGGDPDDGATTTVGADGEVITVYEQADGDGDGDGSTAGAAGSSSGGSREPRIVRLIRKIPELVADALRLIFNNPREFGLMAAVWALLYAPCYLGERRRSIRGLRARRPEPSPG